DFLEELLFAVFFVPNNGDLRNDRLALDGIDDVEPVFGGFEDHFDVVKIAGGQKAADIVIDAGGGVNVPFLDANIGADQRITGCGRANVADFNFADDLRPDLSVAGGQRQRAKNQDKESPSS